MNEILSRIQQVLNDFQPSLTLSDRTRVQHHWYGIPDQLHRRPLVGVLVGLLLRPDDLVFVAVRSLVKGSSSVISIATIPAR
jgi:hypothetical protein